jgi:hypothetical protein
MKALFVSAALYSTSLFGSKLNFATATAKKLSIKKDVAMQLADGVEASTDEALDLPTFKGLFITAATNHVKDAMLAKIVSPIHKAEVIAEVAKVETPEEKKARLARNKASRASKAKAKAAKAELVVA